MALVVGLHACTGPADAPTAGAVEVVDSAGVRVVSLSDPAPADTVSLEPTWVYGTGQPEYLFQRIVSGALLADGTAVIADTGADEVLRIGMDGAAHDVVARTGQGPGDVRGPRQIIAGTDRRIWVEDMQGGKLMLLEGDSVTGVLSGSDNPALGSALMPIGVDSRERLMMTTGGFDPRVEEEWVRGVLAFFTPTEGVVDTVGSFQSFRRPGEPPYFPLSGGGVVTVAGGQFVTARTDIPALTWWSPDGGAVQIARWSAEPRYADDSARADFEASTRGDAERMNPGRSESDYRAMTRSRLERYVLDDSQPMRLFDDIVGARDGSVWIAPLTIADGYATAREWSVMSPEGEWLGAVRFSSPVRILDVDDDRILGVQTNAFDVETVVVYANPL